MSEALFIVGVLVLLTALVVIVFGLIQVSLIDDLRAELQGLATDFQQLLRQQGKATMKLDDVQAKVMAQTTVVGSVVTLLGELSAQLKAAANDPAKVQAIADGIDANSAALANAVTANTPAAAAN